MYLLIDPFKIGLVDFVDLRGSLRMADVLDNIFAKPEHFCQTSLVLRIFGAINVFALERNLTSQNIALSQLLVVGVLQSTLSGFLLFFVPLGYSIQSFDLVPHMTVLKLQRFNILLRLLIICFARYVLRFILLHFFAQ